MGTGMTVAGVGLGLVAIGALVVAAIKFLPGLLEGISDFKFPELPAFPEFPEFPKFPELPDVFGFLDPLNNIRGPGDIVIPFSSTELKAFDFKKLIGRPEILGGEIFATPGGTSIVQSAGKSTTGRKFFGSDFASAERLADLFDRFKVTGRLEPGGRERRIAQLRADAKALQGLETTLTASDRPASAGPVSNHPSTKRGPNVLGVFGAQGVQSRKANVFTGGLNNTLTAPRVTTTRIVTGFTSRASAKTRAFFASGQAGARSARGRI